MTILSEPKTNPTVTLEYQEHAATLARSRNIDGPYEVHPNNPLLVVDQVRMQFSCLSQSP